MTRYSDDLEVTPRKSVLVLHRGGRRGGASGGIHWHADPAIRIRYRSDPKRETIQEVELTRADGNVKVFAPSDPPPGAGAGRDEWRLMDCIDCHNRAAHRQGTPEQAVDEAIDLGRIDRTLPFARREAVRVLRQDYPSRDAARSGIAASFAAFYKESYPELAAAYAAPVAKAAAALDEIYGDNVFPKMKVTWGTYPDHLGHTETAGCFRCHDGNHVASDGTVISQDCDSCHSLLATEEEAPEILKQLQPS